MKTAAEYIDTICNRKMSTDEWRLLKEELKLFFASKEVSEEDKKEVSRYTELVINMCGL